MGVFLGFVFVLLRGSGSSCRVLHFLMHVNLIGLSVNLNYFFSTTQQSIDERLEKKRERNRIAATKCRQRKLHKIQTLGKQKQFIGLYASKLS